MTTDSNIRPPVTMIPLTQKGAIMTTNSYNQRFPRFLPYGKLTDVTLYDLVKHNIPAVDDPDNIPADYGSGLVTVEERIVKAHTFYCDLDADADWDDSVFDSSSASYADRQNALDARNMAGDGSMANPWKNLTYALEKMYCMIQNTCCGYFQLICTGTAHYTARLLNNGGANIFSSDRFILYGAVVEVEKKNGYGFYNLYCWLCCCQAKVTVTNGSGIGYRGCPRLINCSAIVTGANVSGGSTSIIGFQDGNGGTLYNCTATLISVGVTQSIIGYSNMGTSIFYNCTVTGTGEYLFGNHLVGYQKCTQSAFYSCSANLQSKGGNNQRSIYLMGFYDCSNSAFYNYKISLVKNSSDLVTNVREFYNCSNSSFYNQGTNNVVYGYENCSTSYFYHCIVNGGESIRGFYQCSQSSFYDCLSSLDLTDSSSTTFSSKTLNLFGYYGCDNSYFYNSTARVSATLDIATSTTGWMFTGDVSAYGFYCSKSTFYKCNANISAVNKIASLPSTVTNLFRFATAYGFRAYNSSFSACTYSLTSTVDGYTILPIYTEQESECGIYTDQGCQSGYRCESRTQNGTYTC